MKLAHFREVEYLSPSSLYQLERDPLDFYLKRLGPKELRPPRDPQTFPMAVGSVFDKVIKTIWGGGESSFSGIEFERERSIEFGKQLAENYVACGAYDQFLEDGPATGMEVPLHGFVPGTEVPIHGALDAVMAARKLGRYRHPWVVDWKVTGAGREKPKSPNKGYLRHFTNDGLTPKVHKLNDSPMEELNDKWANQLAMYCWLLGYGLGDEPEVGIDQVLPGLDGSVRIAQFRTYVSSEYQEQLKERLCKAWEKIQTRTLVDDTVPLDYQLMMSFQRSWWK